MGTLFILLALALLGALVAGLIKPAWVKQESRKRVAQIFGSTMVVFFIIGGVLSPKSSEVPATATADTSSVVQEATTSPKTEPEVSSLAPSTSKSATTPAPTQGSVPSSQTKDQNTAPVSTQTVSQKNAVAKAKSYLGFSAFSHDGLVAQLEYEQFSHADAVYGADNSGANWNEQAAAKAKSYMSYSSFSRGSLIAQLEYEKFTQAQAEYGANAVGL